MTGLNARLGCRRRCWWCGVPLRLWQINSCRRCKLSSSAPCMQGARWDDEPDRIRVML